MNGPYLFETTVTQFCPTVINGLKAQHVSHKQITNEVGMSLFAKARELSSIWNYGDEGK
jgi:hypothetical protein